MTFRRDLVVAAGAGVLAATGHAPFGFWPVALSGFALLAGRVAMAATPGRAGWAGFAGGVGYFAASLHWIVQPFLVDVARHGWMAPFALVLMAAGLALFWGAAGILSARSGTNRALAWALWLGAAEMARGHVLTGFPWALPAYVWTDTPVRETAAIWGSYGLTLVTLVLAALPAAAGTCGRRAGAALAAAAGFGALFLYAPLRDGGTLPDAGIVRLVQPNAPQDEKWDPDRAHVFVERQIGFTAAPKPGVGLIVWPESAVPYLLDTAAPILDRIATAAGGVPVVLGINRREGGRFYNSLIVVGGDGRPAQVYDKTHLVPFGEYIPLGQLAGLVGLRSFAARDGFGFSPGARPFLLDTPLGPAMPYICYEAIFPGQIRRAAGRPSVLLQITNDAWFGTFSGPYQHLQQARFRAAEQGLPLIRVANTGVSALVDGRGLVRERIALGTAGYLDAVVPGGLAAAPLHSRTGDAPAALVLIAGLAALIVVGRRNTIAKRPTSS